nr:hypothetical protein [Mucilaginibacter sp. SP1R1]
MYVNFIAVYFIHLSMNKMNINKRFNSLNNR